jgi:peptide/nickel transport system substrate-binding protein
VADEKGSWKRFQRLGFDSKKFSRRARKAETTTTRHAHKFVLSKLDALRSVRQHVTTWLLIVGVLIAAIALQMIWYQSAYRTTAWKSGGTYAEAVMGPINTLNPLYATTPAEESATKLIFSSLYRYDDTGALSDDLADAMSVSPNGKQYTVTLRNDAYWSDGHKVTADDIVFTVNLMKSPEVRSVLNSTWGDITAEALGPYTVRFTLPASYAPFPHALTFAVLPKHLLDGVAPGAIRQNAFSVSPVGSGPFVLKLLQLSPDRRHKIVNLSASENYYRGDPKLARFALHAYNGADDMLQALETGEVNAAAGVTVKASELPPAFKVRYYPVNSGVYALFNTSGGLLKDKTLRKALQAGTDTDKLRRAVGYPVRPLHLPFIEGQLSGARVPKPPAYNPAKAKSLLNRAGWKLAKGNSVRSRHGVPLQLRVVTVNDPAYENSIEQLAGQWRELGIDVKTEIKNPASSNQDFDQTTLQPRDYDVLLYKLAIGVDPDVFAYWHSTQAGRLGLNFANYRSAVSDDALASARSRTEPNLRNEKYKVFAQQWLDDAPAVGLYQAAMEYAYRPSVRPEISAGGVASEPDRYADILYWSAMQEQVYNTP